MEYKVGDLVKIERKSFTDEENRHITNYFSGDWIYGQPIEIEQLNGAGMFCKIEHHGEWFNPYLAKKDISPYTPPEQIKADLLKLREELGV